GQRRVPRGRGRRWRGRRSRRRGGGQLQHGHRRATRDGAEDVNDLRGCDPRLRFRREGVGEGGRDRLRYSLDVDPASYGAGEHRRERNRSERRAAGRGEDEEGGPAPPVAEFVRGGPAEHDGVDVAGGPSDEAGAGEPGVIEDLGDPEIDEDGA